MLVSFNLNGVDRRFDVSDPELPLVFALRDAFGLTGTKYGCLEGVCGACTVHVGGVAVRSCQTRIADVAGAVVTTIEGLSDDASHPVQRAWIEMQVAQCGYCQPGQIMQAAALLAQRPNPTTSEIVAEMAGNLCRCGSASRIVAAILRAAEMQRSEKNE